MSLIDDFKDSLVRLSPQRVPDGAGGQRTRWTEGERVGAALVRTAAPEVRRAEQAGQGAVYTLTVERGVVLGYHDVLRRERDGLVLRITAGTGGRETPARADLRLAQAQAEEWRLPQ